MTIPRRQKLVVFGCYSDSSLYSRNKANIEALSSLFEETVVIRPTKSGAYAASNKDRLSSIISILKTAFTAVRSFFSLASQRRKLAHADCIFIPYPAYLDRFFLNILTRRSSRYPIVIDAFLCLYDTVVDDRKIFKTGSFAAHLIFHLERTTMRNADLVFIDTAQQKNLLCDQYNLPDHQVAVVPVGIDEKVWQPLPLAPLLNEFKVVFWGTFIPLHGVQVIAQAAQLLAVSHPTIRFTIIGAGQTSPSIDCLLSQSKTENVTRIDRLLPAEELYQHVKSSHCVLGIFGDSTKAGNVIPYKVYQALASNKVVITRQSEAISSLCSTDQPVGLRLVPAADPQGLAAEIVAVAEQYCELSACPETRSLYEKNIGSKAIYESISQAIMNL